MSPETRPEGSTSDLTKSQPRECIPAPRVAFDALDELPLITIPASLRGKDMRPMMEAATAMYNEGGNGAAIRRLLVREAQIVRASLRFREAVAHIELEKFARGGGDQKRLEFAEASVNRTAKRFLAVVDRITRMDAAPAVNSVTVNAQQAVVAVEGR